MDENQKPVLNGEAPQSVPPSVPDLSDIYPNPNKEMPIANQSHQRPGMGSSISVQSGRGKKSLVIIIVGAVVLASIAAIFFVPKLFGSNKEEMNTILDSINYVLPSTISGCKQVRDDVNSHVLDMDLYEMETTSCKDSVAALFEIVDKFNPGGDVEIKEAFNVFKTSLNTNMPDPDQLGETLEMYTAMHNFNVALRDYMVDGRTPNYKMEKGEKLIETADYFVDSSNDELAQFGNGVKQLYSELYDSWQQFGNEINEMGENSQTNFDKYVSAEKNFYNYAESNKPNISSLYPLANDENGEISNMFNNLMSKL